MDLSLLGISKEELIDRIVEAAAAQVVEHEIMEQRIRSEAHRQVETALGRLAEQEIGKVMSKAMDLEFQPLTIWGEAAGPRISIRAMMLERAQKWLTEHVNSRGETDTSYGYERNPTRAQWYVRRAVEEVVSHHQSEAIKAIIAETTAQIKGALDAALAEVVANRVRK